MTTERRNAVMTFLRLAGTQFVTTILVRYWFVRLDGENSVVQPIVALTRTLFTVFQTLIWFLPDVWTLFIGRLKKRKAPES